MLHLRPDDAALLQFAPHLTRDADIRQVRAQTSDKRRQQARAFQKRATGGPGLLPGGRGRLFADAGEQLFSVVQIVAGGANGAKRDEEAAPMDREVVS